MIYKATEQDFIDLPLKNCAIRIESLKCAYGFDTSFLHFFADGKGCLASLMDGYCIFHSPHGLTDEWQAFFRLLPDIKTLYTDEISGRNIVKAFNLPYKSGSVMRLNKGSATVKQLPVPSLRLVYDLLKRVFVEYTPFDSWYVDVSHRIRHGCCRISTIQRHDLPVACAMTVAETESAVIIGGVATDATHRGQGLAQECIDALLAAIPQETVFIAPVDAYAQRYYERFGFVVCEQRMEIDFT